MNIRKCTAADIKTLVQISLRTFVDAFEKENDPEDFNAYTTVAFSEETLTEQLHNPYSTFYFLYKKDELAGYFKLNEYAAQSEMKGPDTLELERIYVEKAFQGQQLGTFMLKEAIRIASELEKKQLWLGVWQKNINAIRFYEKHGFKKFATHPYYIGQDKQTDWLMRIAIKSPSAIEGA
ncbi:GNAT family N-acetyltransferase [Aggregatimonas sangjinii]|uniref:GNAT family N-acetyltransferase n=1 Tax=Aggregatimonas sangjinii TaxID=2583587 RepID=A0A5B7SWZ3_9FLAO|nr:GNAT family N-acetyltransferase [Aggregatimonas sangjinii]QCX01799.1 GNAT family N-acetyltransferase [Aggregatimonas sangjinii]